MSTEIERLVVRLTGDNTGYLASLNKAMAATKKFSANMSRRLKAIGSSMRSIGANLSMKLTAPLTLMGGAAVRAFDSFDQAMTESTSIMKTTEDQVVRMRNQAKEMSKTFVQSPKEIGEAFFFLASAGMDAEQAMASMGTVATFATAGAFDMALATDLLTDAQTAMGLESDNAAESLKNLKRIGDVFVAANQSANTSVQQVAEAMTSDAGVAAKDYGLSLESTTAILEAYASGNKKGAEGGNLFGRATRLITSAHRKNGAAFKKYGINMINESTGEYIDLIDVIGDLEKAFENLTGPQRKAAMAELGFQDLAQKSITPLMGRSKAMKEYRQKLVDAGDAAQEVADKQLKSFSNQMTIVWNNVKLVGIEIGEILAPYILKIGEYVKRGVAIWQSFSKRMKIVIVGVVGFVAALGPLLLGFGTFAALVGSAVSGITALLGFLAPLAPLLAVATLALAGLIGAALHFGVTWQDAWNMVKEFGKNTFGYFNNFKENLSALWKWLGDNWWNLLKDMVVMLGTIIKNMVTNNLTFIHTLFRLYIAFMGQMQAVWEKIFHIDFIHWIKVGLNKATELLNNFVVKMSTMVIKAMAGESVEKSAIDQIKDDYTAGLEEGFLEAGKGIIGEQMDKLKSPLAGFESSVTEGPNQIWTIPEWMKPKKTEIPKVEIAKVEGAGKVGGMADAAVGAVGRSVAPGTGRAAVSIGSAELQTRLQSYSARLDGVKSPEQEQKELTKRIAETSKKHLDLKQREMDERDAIMQADANETLFGGIA